MSDSPRTAPRRIGIFGGSFDPPHNAHVALARAARDALALDEVRWIPAGAPWQKSRAITPAEQRVAMVALAIGGEPCFVLDRCEVDRTGPSYTLDTVREQQAQDPSAVLVLIIGADQYANLHTWRGWRELLAGVTLAVANRPGQLPEVDAEVQRTPHAVVPLPLLDVSATDIRARCARNEAIAHLVPAAVAGYIAQHALYGAAHRS